MHGQKCCDNIVTGKDSLSPFRIQTFSDGGCLVDLTVKQLGHGLILAHTLWAHAFCAVSSFNKGPLINHGFIAFSDLEFSVLSKLKQCCGDIKILLVHWYYCWSWNFVWMYKI